MNQTELEITPRDDSAADNAFEVCVFVCGKNVNDNNVKLALIHKTCSRFVEHFSFEWREQEALQDEWDLSVGCRWHKRENTVQICYKLNAT